jgi:hypothetical protein
MTRTGDYRYIVTTDPISIKPHIFVRGKRRPAMSYNNSGPRTTIGWSLLSSGIVTLILKVMPPDSLWWGLLLIAVGIAVMVYR